LLCISVIYNLYQSKKINEGYDQAADIIYEAYTLLRKKQLESKGKRVSNITKLGGHNR